MTSQSQIWTYLVLTHFANEKPRGIKGSILPLQLILKKSTIEWPTVAIAERSVFRKFQVWFGFGLLQHRFGLGSGFYFLKKPGFRVGFRKCWGYWLNVDRKIFCEAWLILGHILHLCTLIQIGTCWRALWESQYITRARQQILLCIDDKKYLLLIQWCKILCGLAKN